jgi:thiosulfate dehydrogenase [quinone] large subunit
VALSGWCNHQACDVRESPSGFRCPCHGATFAADGALTSGPATQSLIRFTTESTDMTLTILANA